MGLHISVDEWRVIIDSCRANGTSGYSDLVLGIKDTLQPKDLRAWQSGMQPKSVRSLMDALSDDGLLVIMHNSQILIVPAEIPTVPTDALLGVISDIESVLEKRAVEHLRMVARDNSGRSKLFSLLAIISSFSSGLDVPGVSPADVQQLIDVVIDMFFPSLENLVPIPPLSFWREPVGAMLSRALAYVGDDELITYKEASDLVGVPIQNISNAVRRGRLKSIPNPASSHPTKEAFLVPKSEVKKLWAKHHS